MEGLSSVIGEPVADAGESFGESDPSTTIEALVPFCNKLLLSAVGVEVGDEALCGKLVDSSFGEI
jgi:hypothetical protein